MKRISVALAIMMVFAINIGTQTFASVEIDQQPSNIAPPTSGICPKGGIAETPGGRFTARELNALKKKVENRYKEPLVKNGNSEVTADHFSFTAHRHYVERITNTYDGFYERGEVASSYNGASTQGTMLFSIQRSLSNAWNTSITFDADVVKVATGYNLSWTETKTWS